MVTVKEGQKRRKEGRKEEIGMEVGKKGSEKQDRNWKMEKKGKGMKKVEQKEMKEGRMEGRKKGSGIEVGKKEIEKE